MSEETLMLAVKNGELQKLAILFEKYKSHLFNFFVRMTWDQELSADLAQNVFVRILKYRHTFREGMRFKPWIFQIARNVHSDHFRSHHHQTDSLNSLDVLNLEDDKEQNSRHEKEAILHQAMDQLDVTDKELLVMSKFQKMKHEEIGEIMGISVSNVKVKIHRAIKRLRIKYFELEETL